MRRSNKPSIPDWIIFADETVLGLMAVLLAFAVMFTAVWIKSSYEAAAFNRLTTGPKVTVWDAVFLDLRVEAK